MRGCAHIGAWPHKVHLIISNLIIMAVPVSTIDSITLRFNIGFVSVSAGDDMGTSEGTSEG